jgi:protein-S-isoprenylcysteine O-methyltransferase Ste14
MISLWSRIMEKKLFIILVVVSIITHIVRTTYEILKHKKKLEANKLTFIIIFINMGLLWTSWFLLCSHDIYKINLSDFVRYLGLLIFCIGIIVFFIALFTIKTLESYEGELITKGIYSKIRHPMYFGFILWLIGFPIFFGSLFSFFLSFLFIANILFWKYLEEIELEKRFNTYLNYKKTTLF